MIGHGGLLRVFSFTHPIGGGGGLGISRGFTPRHAQTVRDSVFLFVSGSAIVG